MNILYYYYHLIPFLYFFMFFYYSNYVQEMDDSYLRTAQAVKQEDAAVEEVPERAAMLEAMRKEFPTIDITAR